MAELLPLDPDGALSLALVVVAASHTPLLMLDGDLKVLAASKSFCSAFDIDAAAALRQPLSAMGAGEWNLPQLQILLRATLLGQADIEAYEMDLIRTGAKPRRLVLNVQKLAYDDAQAVRLLLAVLDVTDSRAADKVKDDRLREKTLQLQEVQHRIANSLQIIASILMQSARRVKTEEIRDHLHDARNRVMSIGALQQQLAASHRGDVNLRHYFQDLSDSISASMIRDHGQIALSVSVDDSVTSADTSVSLGLLVTELVINALKHGFPDHRHGKIDISYSSRGESWSLTVSDNGVGMPKPPALLKPGLGTIIIESLAKQLSGEIVVVNRHPGTSVCVTGGAVAEKVAA